MDKVCKTCGAFDVCIMGQAGRTAECPEWRPKIVRCKECQHRADGTNQGNYMCNRKMFGLIKPDDFCSYGEKRQ